MCHTQPLLHVLSHLSIAKYVSKYVSTHSWIWYFTTHWALGLLPGRAVAYRQEHIDIYTCLRTYPPKQRNVECGHMYPVMCLIIALAFGRKCSFSWQEKFILHTCVQYELSLPTKGLLSHMSHYSFTLISLLNSSAHWITLVYICRLRSLLECELMYNVHTCMYSVYVYIHIIYFYHIQEIQLLRSTLLLSWAILSHTSCASLPSSPTRWNGSTGASVSTSFICFKVHNSTLIIMDISKCVVLCHHNAFSKYMYMYIMHWTTCILVVYYNNYYIMYVIIIADK